MNKFKLLKCTTTCLFIVLLSGCMATQTEEPVMTGKYTELHDAESKALYATLLPPGSALEAEALGDKAYAKGELDKALYYYVQSLELDATDPEVFYKIGELHADRGNMGLAEYAYTNAITLDPNHAGALQGMGLIRFKQRNFTQAKQYLEDAVKNDPRRWRALNALGIIADLEDDYPTAQSYFYDALDIVPGTQKVLNNLAYSYFLEGQTQKSVTLFKGILAHDPANKRAWGNLGLVYAKEEDYRDSYLSFEHIMEEYEAYNMVGYLIMIEQEHLNTDDVEKYRLAEDYFNRSIKLSPVYNAQAYNNLERLYRIKGTAAIPYSY